MKVYLLRHGRAVAIGERGVLTDEDRRLTPEGRRVTQKMLRAIRETCRPCALWTSPLVRARETAEIARRTLGIRSKISILESLRPGTDPRTVVRWLRSRQETSSIMLVGHMPDLAILAATLVFGVEQEGIAIKKSGVCCIGFKGPVAAGAGRLEWLMSPALQQD